MSVHKALEAVNEVKHPESMQSSTFPTMQQLAVYSHVFTFNLYISAVGHDACSKTTELSAKRRICQRLFKLKLNANCAMEIKP